MRRHIALCLALGLCGCAGEQEVERTQPAVAAKPAALHRASDDDARKQLSARLAPRLSRSRAVLTDVIHPDGRRSLRVNGGFSQAQVARSERGRVTTACVEDLPAAQRALEAEP